MPGDSARAAASTSSSHARSPARTRYRAARSSSSGSDVRTGCLAERERLGRVMSQEVGVVGHAFAGHLLEPVGSSLVLGGPRTTRDLAVGDVADQRVPERVFGLTFDRRQPCRAQELLAGQLMEALADVLATALAHRLECSRPEDLADDGSVLEQPLAVRRQRVEPCGDEPLDRCRAAAGPRRSRARGTAARTPPRTAGCRRPDRGAQPASPPAGRPPRGARRRAVRSRPATGATARPSSSCACRRPTPDGVS